MKPNALAAMNAGLKATNKMFDRCTDPAALVYIAIADNYGRIMHGGITPHEDFLFERLAVFDEMMTQPYVQGRDLVDAGIAPDNKFGEYIEYAHKLRLAGVDKDSALKQTLAYIRKKK